MTQAALELLLLAAFVLGILSALLRGR